MTATKRSTKLESTPIAISAITGAQLQAAGIADISAVAQQTGGLAVNSQGAGKSTFNINGIASGAGTSATVGFYLDDVALTPPTDAGQNSRFFFDPDLYDVQRVEVLRGPQGTLYGAGSEGGTIRLITNQPDPTKYDASVHLQASGTQGGGANFAGDAMVNIPLVADMVALRGVYSDKQYDGWIDRDVLNPFPGPVPSQQMPGMRGNVLGAPVQSVQSNVNSEQLHAVRGTLLIKPLTNLKITLGIVDQRISQAGEDTADVPPGLGYETHYQPFNIAEPSLDHFTLYDASVVYDLPHVSLTSISAYTDHRSYQVEDESEDYYTLFGAVSPPLIPTSIDDKQESKQFSQELRLASNDSGRLQYVVGMFYENFLDNFSNNSVVAPYLPLYGTSIVADVHQNDRLKEIAGFGEATYAITKRLKLTLGLRYYEFKYFNYTNEGTSLSSPPPPYNTASNAVKGSSFLPKVSLSYETRPGLLTYFTYSQGSRVGGSNVPVPTTSPNDCTASLTSLGYSSVPLTYQGDKVDSYELGQKARLFQGRLTVNASLFYIGWNQVQQLTRLSCGYPLTLNEGNATSKGFNADLTARITDELQVGASTGYTNATYNQTIPGVETAGEQLQDVPKWTHSVYAEYDQPLNDRFTLRARAAYQHYDSTRDIAYKPAYTQANVRLGVSWDKADVAFYVNNISNAQEYLSNANSLAANIPTLDRVATNRPRTYGIDLNYHF